MHTMAKKMLKEYLKNILDTLVIDEKYFPDIPFDDVLEDNIIRATKILNKANLKLDLGDLYLMMLEEASKYARRYLDDRTQITSVELSIIRAGVLSSLMKRINDYPLKYTALISLPIVRLLFANEIVVSDDLSIFIMQDSSIYTTDSIIPGEESYNELARLNSKGLNDGVCYIKVQVEGYASHSKTGYLPTEIVSAVKRMMAAMYCGGQIEFRDIDTANSFGVASRKYLDDPIYVYETGKEGEGCIREYAVPSDLRAMLNRLVLKSSIFEMPSLLQSMAGLSPGASKKDIAEANLEAISRVLSEDNDDTKRLRTAFDWYAECLMNSNETFQYILGSISLEALLGGKKGDVSLTRILADRSAYLLKKKQSERDLLSTRIRELYQKRSDLVHGSISRLSRDDHDCLEELKGVVNLLIKKELDNYCSTIG